MTLPNSTSVQYYYDREGRLVGKEMNGTLVEGFLYDGQLNPIAETDASGQIVEQFVYGTRANVPDYIIKSGVEYRVISNQVGSPVLIVNAATGSIAEQISYDAWGNITAISAAVSSRGTGACASKARAEGAEGIQPPVSAASGAPPRQGTSVEALRPAWASCMPGTG